MKRWRTQTSWVVRWGGVVVTVVIVAAFAWSLFSVTAYDGPRLRLEMMQGALYPRWTFTPGDDVIEMQPADPSGWYTVWDDGRISPVLFWWVHTERGTQGCSGVIPLWMPLVLVLLPTGLAWWGWGRAQRRERIGMCRGCGYDLEGIANGVCPECGGKTP